MIRHIALKIKRISKAKVKLFRLKLNMAEPKKIMLFDLHSTQQLLKYYH